MWCSFTFTRGKSFVPHRLPIVPHNAGYGFGSHRDVAMVAVVGDLRPQFIVVAQSTGVHDVTGVETGLAWFFCAVKRADGLFDESYLDIIHIVLIIGSYSVKILF